MLRFKTFILEGAVSDVNGKMHELTTAYHLNGGKHVGSEQEEHFKSLSSGMSKEEIDRHMHRGKVTADAIKKRLADNGEDVHSVHLTSKAGDIKKLTGHDESQHDNPSDVMVKTKDGKYRGYSLKTVNKKGGHAGISNPGHGRIDSELGISTMDHLKKAHAELEDKHPELKGKSMAEKKTMSKESSSLKSSATEHMKKAHNAVVSDIANKVKSMDDHERVKFFRHHFHMNHSKVSHERVTAHGDKEVNVRIEHPGYQGDNVRHVEVSHSGTNINFHVHDHEGNVHKYALRAKGSSGPFSSLKFSGEYKGKAKK